MVYEYLDSPLENLEWLEKNMRLDSLLKHQIFTLKQELRYMRTYLIYMAISEAIPSGSSSLIGDVETAITKPTEEFYSASSFSLDISMTNGKVGSVISYMLQKVKYCDPEIRKAYQMVKKQPLESESNTPMMPASLVDFIDSVLQNLQDLLYTKSLVDGMKRKIERLKEKLSFLRHFLHTTAKTFTTHQKMGAFLTFVHTSCTTAASLSYFCWIAERDEIVEFGIDRELSELAQKIRSGSSDVIELYFEFLKESNLKGSDNANTDEVESLVNFLVENSYGSVKDQIASIHEELIYLITFLIDPPNECRGDWEWFAEDTKAVAREAGSFYVEEMKEEQVKQMNLVISRSLQNMKLIRAEIFLVRLQSPELGLNIYVKDQVKIFQEEFRFLRTFLMNPPMKNKDEGELILRKSEDVANEAASLVVGLFDNLTNDNEGIGMEMDLISEMLQKIVLLKEEIKHIYLQFLQPLHSDYPTVGVLVFISSFSEKMRELINRKVKSITFVKHHIEIIHAELELLKSFLMDSVKQHIDHQELNDLWVCITDVAYKAEHVIDSFMVRDNLLWYFMLWHSVSMEELEVIKAKIMKICDDNVIDLQVHRLAKPSQVQPLDENVVDLKYEALMMIHQLTGGTEMTDIVGIVGMPGFVKTNLATKVYNDLSVVNFFDIRIWYCVDKEYEHREALIDISCYTDIRIPNYTLTDEYDIGESLYYYFKEKRYLIVIENWHISAWCNLEKIFPSVGNGSRLLFID